MGLTVRLYNELVDAVKLPVAGTFLQRQRVCLWTTIRGVAVVAWVGFLMKHF